MRWFYLAVVVVFVAALIIFVFPVRAALEGAAFHPPLSCLRPWRAPPPSARCAKTTAPLHANPEVQRFSHEQFRTILNLLG